MGTIPRGPLTLNRNTRKDLVETRKELADFLYACTFSGCSKKAEDVLKDIAREISTS